MYVSTICSAGCRSVGKCSKRALTSSPTSKQRTGKQEIAGIVAVILFTFLKKKQAYVAMSEKSVRRHFVWAVTTQAHPVV